MGAAGLGGGTVFPGPVAAAEGSARVRPKPAHSRRIVAKWLMDRSLACPRRHHLEPSSGGSQCNMQRHERTRFSYPCAHAGRSPRAGKHASHHLHGWRRTRPACVRGPERSPTLRPWRSRMRFARPSVRSLSLSLVLVTLAFSLASVSDADARGRPVRTLVLTPENVVPGPGEAGASGAFTWSGGRNEFCFEITVQN